MAWFTALWNFWWETFKFWFSNSETVQIIMVPAIFLTFVVILRKVRLA